jgi:hypothetical protein
MIIQNNLTGEITEVEETYEEIEIVPVVQIPTQEERISSLENVIIELLGVL